MVHAAVPKLTAKGRATRQRIVCAASALMLERGVARTTIEDIQEAANVSTSQMYHYFADRAVLAIAPTPAAAAKLSVSRIAAALRRAGRSRGIEQAAAEIKAGLRKLQLRQPLLVESAMGKHTLALHGRAAAGRRAGTAASGGVAGVRDARRIDTACINV